MKNVEMYVDSFKSKYESFLIGCDSVEEMGLWDKEALGEMEVFYLNDMISIIIRLIVTDGLVTEKEVEYLNKTFDFNYSIEELTEIYENCAENIIGEAFDENFENGITYMRKINAKLADLYKEILILICDIIIESDGIIDEKEAQEVVRLKALCE